VDNTPQAKLTVQHRASYS